MARRARVDENQAEIVEALREVGATVLHTHTLKCAFDLLVGFRGKDTKMEVKNGDLPPSKQALTPGEQEFHDTWRGEPVRIVRSVGEALKAIGAI